MKRKAVQLGKLCASKSAEKQRGHGITPVGSCDGQTEEMLAATGGLKAMLQDGGTMAEGSPFDCESTTHTVLVEPHPVTAVFERGRRGLFSIHTKYWLLNRRPTRGMT